MKTIADMRDRAELYLRQNGACTPERLTSLLYAVYNDGVRDMKDEAVLLARKVKENAATVRVENEAGLSVQQGRRLAAEAIEMAIGSVSAMKEELRNG